MAEKRQELLAKAEILRSYELAGYQTAYFLLENQTLAEQAALEALKELLNDPEFFLLSAAIQQQKAKQTFIRHALRTKAESCGLAV